jgi:hypothetical protein
MGVSSAFASFAVQLDLCAQMKMAVVCSQIVTCLHLPHPDAPFTRPDCTRFADSDRA